MAFKATIDKGWYVYSQFLEPGGPEPTIIVYDKNAAGATQEKAVETSAYKVEGMDPVFGMNVIKFKEEVTFTQKIKVEKPDQPLTGYVSFMACDDTKCLPPTDVPFLITPSALTAVIGDDAKAGTVQESGAGIVFDKSNMADCGVVAADGQEKKGLWSIFLWGLLGGFIALLTPCVFPMVPLTVSFFTKSSGTRSKGLFNAGLYGFFILLVYVLCSLPFHLLDSVSPDILNDISTNVWLNIAFFVVFLAFAFSFFGYYELTLPSSWANKVSSAEGIGGVAGIFFMALTLVLVSFWCTGPILGTLLGTVMDSKAGPD